MRWPESPYPKLSQQQREYVLGAVLGDDSLLMNTGSLHAMIACIMGFGCEQENLGWKDGSRIG